MHPGNRLRSLRKSASITQEELAVRTGITQERISKYENGKTPMRIEEMRIMARELGCAVADILDDKDNPERLNQEERQLLQAFRELDQQSRDFLVTSAQAVADQRQGQRAKAA